MDVRVVEEPSPYFLFEFDGLWRGFIPDFYNQTRTGHQLSVCTEIFVGVNSPVLILINKAMKNKRTKYYNWVLAGVLALCCGCNDWLDVKPRTELQSDIIYANEKGRAAKFIIPL